MADEPKSRRYTVPAAPVIAIPRETVQKLLAKADGDAALVYLSILSEGAVPPAGVIAERVGRSESDVSRALGTLADIGLINRAVSPTRVDASPMRVGTLHRYTPEEIERELQNGTVFKSLVDAVQRRLGCILSPSGLQTLFGIYNDLGLPPEVIVMLVSYCCKETKRRSGSDRVPTMRAIEREAYIWESEGIVTSDMADDYIRQSAERQSAEARMARLLHVDGRRLSAEEKDLFDSWAEMGFDNDTIILAYDKTVNTTGRAAWKYMNKILLNWHEANAHTPEEVRLFESSRSKRRDAAPGENTSASGTAEELASLRRAIRRIQTQ